MHRVDNEDYGAVSEELYNNGTVSRGIFVVCDGMGGHRSGKLAAEKAANAFMRVMLALETGVTPSEAAKAADAAVLSIEGGFSDRSPGATLTALIMTDAGVQIAHVGDSEAYRLTAAGEFEKLTKDHSGMFGLDNFCGLGQNFNGFFCDVTGRSLQVGDKFLLATDGLTKHVKPAELPDLMRRVATKDLAVHLVELANERGGCDNTTVIAVEVRE
jgi:protein phosphatase